MGVADELRALTDVTHRAVMEINRVPEAVRQTLADNQWAQIPLFVSEKAYAANLAAGGVLSVTPQTTGLEVITSVVAVVPTGATGVLQLADLFLPLPAGVTQIAPVQFTLGTADIRSLTIAGAAGAAALWLTGQQLPTFNVLAK